MKFQSPAREKSYLLAKDILVLLRKKQKDYVAQPFLIQLARSATSIGANLEEAAGAESRADFRHKISLAQKEARETLYWLMLLQDTGYIPQTDVVRMKEYATAIVKMLIATKRTLMRTPPNSDTE
jgi:four helix bundle protein